MKLAMGKIEDLKTNPTCFNNCPWNLLIVITKANLSGKLHRYTIGLISRHHTPTSIYCTYMNNGCTLAPVSSMYGDS